MAYRKAYTQYVTTAANANEQQFNLATPDNYQEQRVRSIFAGITTAGVVVGLYLKGAQKLTVDCTRFAAGNHPLMCDVTVPAQVPPVVSVRDIAGNAHISLPIVIEYDVDQD